MNSTLNHKEVIRGKDLIINSSEDSIKIKTPLAMQYLGGKGRIVDQIFDCIDNNCKGSKIFIDIFSGSGIIAYNALARGYNVIANDIQPYSAIFLNAILNNNKTGINKLIEKLKEIRNDSIFNESRKRYFKEYQEEKRYFNLSKSDHFDWKAYKQFCDDTILISGTKKDIIELKKRERWTLFLAYYRNTYFGVKQCAEIDYLREFSETISDNQKNIY
ncbi:hypothetical protein FACS1894110_17210 [Spirochaetia bacterium]|nr:hypothetical protein FACS1894110_17210 [Spirochaetia bacterium]